MDFRFISVLVVFAGLFGLAFVILGVLQRSSNQRSRQRRGRDDKGPEKQLAGKQGPKRPSFHPCAAPGCSQNIPGQDLCGQCFTCLGLSHDMNLCDVCLLAKPSTQQCRAIRLYLWNLAPPPPSPVSSRPGKQHGHWTQAARGSCRLH